MGVIWPMLHIFISFAIVNTAPLLEDLHQHFTSQYAVQWKVIGTLLGLPSGELDIIEHDNMWNATHCCNAMLEKWLEVDPTASWNKLFAVIELPAVAYGVPKKGIYSSCMIVYYCILSRVNNMEESV